MFHMTQTQRGVLGSIILMMTMTFGSMSAHASLVSWNVLAAPVGGFGTTSFDLTFFLDAADIPGTGTAIVTFSSVDVIWTGDAFSGPQSFTYANNDIRIQDFFGLIQLVPFTGEVTAGGALSVIRGVQPGPGGPNTLIARMFFNPANSIGPLVQIIFFAGGIKANAERDDALFVPGSLTGPISVSAVPLPAALPLFGSALAMLGIVGWRRRRQAGA